MKSTGGLLELWCLSVAIMENIIWLAIIMIPCGLLFTCIADYRKYGSWTLKYTKQKHFNDDLKLKNFENEIDNIINYELTNKTSIYNYVNNNNQMFEYEIISKIEILKPIKNEKVDTKKLMNVKNDTISFETGFFFKKTHYIPNQTLVTKDVKMKYERTVVRYYKDGNINYGD